MDIPHAFTRCGVWPLSPSHDPSMPASAWLGAHQPAPASHPYPSLLAPSVTEALEEARSQAESTVSMCDSNSLFPLCSSKSFCAGARRAEGGLLHDRRHLTNYHSCHCPRGLTGKEHLPSSSLDPCFSQTLSVSLTTCCEMARRSGAWRQRRRDIYLQKNHKQTEGGEGLVCRKGW